MHIQGRKLKKGNMPQKGVLYEFSDSRVITFTECEVRDVVDIAYQLDAEEKGFFAEEYRSDTVARVDAKVIDITALIINEKANVCHWWLYDLKKDVGGRDVIRHLCEQWQAAYQYLSNSVLNYLMDIPMEISGNIGVITRNFDTERIQSEFEKVDQTIKEMEADASQVQILAKRKSNVRLPILRETRDLLKNVLHKKVCFRCAGKDIELPFDIKISVERGDGTYYYRLTCKQGLC